MGRFRRPAQFPFLFLTVALVVFFGGRSVLHSVNLATNLELVNTLDFDVPLSNRESLISMGENGEPIEGRAFPDEAVEMTQFLEDVTGSAINSFESNEVVFVIYASSNHFVESRESLRRLRQVTNNTIIYYDLGLGNEQVEDLKRVCNLEVVKFNFDRYPNHTKNLMTYAFKPILMGEMYQKYRAFWIIDASARFFSLKEMENFYNKVRRGLVQPFSAEHPAGHTIYSATHEGMYAYLPLPMKGGKMSGMRQALTMFVVRSKMAKEVTKWNMRCALTEACIAPPQSSPFCGSPAVNQNPTCHRFDQSSVNIVMCVLNLRRNLSCLAPSATIGAYSNLVGVERDSGYSGPLPTC